jgi:predicted acetyltransferase
MIRAATEADRSQLVRLWQICFHDEEDTIQLFLQRLNQDVSCRVDEQDGKVVAAAYLIDAKMTTPRGLVPVWYEYALGTLPEYRGKGIMTRLLDNIRKEARRRKIPYTALVPAEEKLAPYYEKQGYRWFFTLRQIEMPRTWMMQLGNSPAEEIRSGEEPDGLRERLLRPLIGSLEWSAPSVSFALQFAEHCGGRVLRVPGGYAVCHETDDTLHITEWMSTPKAAPALARQVCAYSDCPKMRLRLTEYNPLFPGVGEMMYFGMLRSTGNDPLPKSSGAYIGLEVG